MELRNNYYEAIKDFTKEEDIVKAIAEPLYDDNLEIIEELIRYLDYLLKEVEEVLRETPLDDVETIEYTKEEIVILQLKKDICLMRLEQGKEDIKIEKEAKLVPNKNIIFATTESGNVCIENDMKPVPEEFYTSVERLLIRLEEGVVEDNGQKARGFTSINKKLIGIHEIKEFKVRLFYKNLSPDTVYVLMVRMKKADNDRLDREEIINRATQRNKQYERLKKEIKDPIKKEKLIQEHKKTLDSLIGNIKHNKR